MWKKWCSRFYCKYLLNIYNINYSEFTKTVFPGTDVVIMPSIFSTLGSSFSNLVGSIDTLFTLLYKNVKLNIIHLVQVILIY